MPPSSTQILGATLVTTGLVGIVASITGTLPAAIAALFYPQLLGAGSTPTDSVSSLQALAAKEKAQLATGNKTGAAKTQAEGQALINKLGSSGSFVSNLWGSFTDIVLGLGKPKQ